MMIDACKVQIILIMFHYFNDDCFYCSFSLAILYHFSLMWRVLYLLSVRLVLLSFLRKAVADGGR